jgi:hypothetical protein
MKSLSIRSTNPTFSYSALAIALLGLSAVASPAKADTFPLSPTIATEGGFGNTFSTSGSSVTMSITNDTNYAKLTWGDDSSVSTPGYPAGLTLGNFGGATANVTDLSGGQPYYELAFTDSSDSLGQAAATDQILLIEFQGSTVSGSTMGLSTTGTEFNLYDNTSGAYLEGGQAVTNTIAGWLALFPSLDDESLQELRLAIGLAGGPGAGESATVNSFDVTGPSAVPEPTSLALLFTIVGATAWGARRRRTESLRG